MSYQLTNSVSYDISFLFFLGNRIRVFFLRIFCGNQQLCLVQIFLLWLCIRSSHIKSRFFIVFHITDLFFHDLSTNKVGRIRNFSTTSKVHTKVNAHFILCIFRILVGIVFFHKDFRPCKSEFINTLLDITYHKAIKSALILARNTL